ncbi:carbonic anhydrase [Myxococcota bacterium]|nr:carbonic anhydrase [Myxococcota bacterium]
MNQKSSQRNEVGATRREMLHGTLGATLALGVGQSLAASSAHASTGGEGSAAALSSGHQAILDRLMEGNQRFISGHLRKHDMANARGILAKGQRPDTAVIRCADSRVAPELVFDQNLGELFVCGVAGNIPTPELMASIEYAVAVLGTRMILIMGHSSCGAVDAAIQHQTDVGALPGSLPGLIAQILPSVLKAQKTPGDTLAHSIKQNSMDAASRLTKMSTVVEEAVNQGEVGIASGVYELSSGRFIVNSPS